MKVGRGFFGPMSKLIIKRASTGRMPLLYMAALVLLGLTVVLTGCGEISLNQLLENEEPGELRASPTTASVPVGSTVTISGQGGFRPYTYVMQSGSGVFNENSGVYTAPSFAETAEFLITDGFGSTDTSQIEVIAPLILYANGDLVSTLTIPDSATVAFDADGGKVAFKYGYFLNGVAVDPAEVNAAGQWTFDPPSGDGQYTVEVVDDLENLALVRVSVIMVTPGGQLAISPTETQVEQGQTVSFTGINVLGTAVYTATAGSFNGTSPDDIYTAPSPFTGTVVVTLTDTPSGNFVTATVHVLGVDPGTLAITISPSKIDLIWGDPWTFVASGGIGPYTFWLGADANGSLIQVSDTEAVYTAPYTNTVDWLWVGDSVGTAPATAKIKVKAK